MHLRQSNAELYIPDGLDEGLALSRTTRLAVGAHQDDLEIMAFDGIMACFQQPDQWFAGVVVTNGAGAPRAGVYERFTDEEMIDVRRKEQKKAALLGDYGAQFLLDYPSAPIKDGANMDAVDDLAAILEATRPEILYAHNPADKHDTHVGVTGKLVAALRRLPQEKRPKKFYGCEVWRDLDWMTDADKVALDVSADESLQAALLGVFDSQVCGGKRYDLATLGRRRAHATYHASHGVDETTGLTFAMDLSPLLTDDALDLEGIVRAHLERFADDVYARLAKLR
jgi:LmbE family N-acetylglucosaminyl deacetylase